MVVHVITVSNYVSVTVQSSLAVGSHYGLVLNRQQDAYHR